MLTFGSLFGADPVSPNISLENRLQESVIDSSQYKVIEEKQQKIIAESDANVVITRSSKRLRLKKDVKQDIGGGFSALYTGSGTGVSGADLNNPYPVAFVDFYRDGYTDSDPSEGTKEGGVTSLPIPGGFVRLHVEKVYNDAADIRIEIVPNTFAASNTPITLKETMPNYSSASINVGQSAISKDGRLRIKVLGVLLAENEQYVRVHITSDGTESTQIVWNTESGVVADPFQVFAFTRDGQVHVAGSLQPTLDLKVNGSDGPLTVQRGDTAQLTWDAKRTDTCVVGYAPVNPGAILSERLHKSASSEVDTTTLKSATSEVFIDDVRIQARCQSGVGTFGVDDHVIVNVVGDGTPPSCSIDIDESVKPNVLRWTSTNTARAMLSLYGFEQPVSVQGEQPVYSYNLPKGKLDRKVAFTVENEVGNATCLTKLKGLPLIDRIRLLLAKFGLDTLPLKSQESANQFSVQSLEQLEVMKKERSKMEEQKKAEEAVAKGPAPGATGAQIVTTRQPDTTKAFPSSEKVPLAKFAVRAGALPVRLHEVTVALKGTIRSEDVIRLRLLDDAGNELTDARFMKGGNAVAKFWNAHYIHKDPVLPNSERFFTIVVDLESTAKPGATIWLEVIGIKEYTGVNGGYGDRDITSEYPVRGTTVTISAAAAGSVRILHTPGRRTVSAPMKNAELARFTIEAGAAEDVGLKRLAIRLNNSRYEDRSTFDEPIKFSNIVLVVGDMRIPLQASDSPVSDYEATMNIVIPRGKSVPAVIYADIDSSSGGILIVRFQTGKGTGVDDIDLIGLANNLDILPSVHGGDDMWNFKGDVLQIPATQ